MFDQQHQNTAPHPKKLALQNLMILQDKDDLTNETQPYFLQRQNITNRWTNYCNRLFHFISFTIATEQTHKQGCSIGQQKRKRYCYEIHVIQVLKNSNIFIIYFEMYKLYHHHLQILIKNTTQAHVSFLHLKRFRRKIALRIIFVYALYQRVFKNPRSQIVQIIQISIYKRYWAHSQKNIHRKAITQPFHKYPINISYNLIPYYCYLFVHLHFRPLFYVSDQNNC
eukprot:TRINITY_DN19070_c0_g1_i1.p1 TRINITY_DN19070_c0_g1~~TRINITY_DN19070_c0_g1_i1.p1  ORF type:complete len:225 (+),score=-23.57 TRINITY_DN19070_c0_g1_i1:148-822(+)